LQVITEGFEQTSIFNAVFRDELRKPMTGDEPPLSVFRIVGEVLLGLKVD
jgi:hypothetical protein